MSVSDLSVHPYARLPLARFLKPVPARPCTSNCVRPAPVSNSTSLFNAVLSRNERKVFVPPRSLPLACYPRQLRTRGSTSCSACCASYPNLDLNRVLVTSQDTLDSMWPNPIALTHYRWKYPDAQAPGIVRYEAFFLFCRPFVGIPFLPAPAPALDEALTPSLALTVTLPCS